jgi:hypothetical protein
MGRQYFLKKLTQSSQGNKVLDAPSSILDGFLSRDTYVSLTQLNRPLSNKMSVLPP